jgi:hypothetical protein
VIATSEAVPLCLRLLLVGPHTQAAAGTLDGLVNTVSAPHDLAALLSLLKVRDVTGRVSVTEMMDSFCIFLTSPWHLCQLLALNERHLRACCVPAMACRRWMAPWPAWVPPLTPP